MTDAAYAIPNGSAARPDNRNPADPAPQPETQFQRAVAEELLSKRVTPEAWAQSQKRRRLRIEGAATHRPLRCACGLSLYDLGEYAIHRDTIRPEDRAEHEVREE